MNFRTSLCFGNQTYEFSIFLLPRNERCESQALASDSHDNSNNPMMGYMNVEVYERNLSSYQITLTFMNTFPHVLCTIKRMHLIL